MSEPSKIFLIGYYGFNNVGDEWLLHKTVFWVRDSLPTAKICALYSPKKLAKSRNAPFHSSSAFQELTYCNRNAPLQVLKTVITATHIVCGGGSLLQDKTSQKSLWYYTLLLIIARLLRKKVILIGQGIGPIQHKFSRFLIKMALQNIHNISTRDAQSQADLLPIPATCASDVAYIHSRIQPEHLLPRHNQKAPLIGLNLHPRIAPALKKDLCTAICTLGQDFIFLSFYPQQDNLILQEHPELLSKMVDHWTPWQHKTPPPCPALKHHTFKWIFPMRYHAAVWASLRGIPFLALAEDPKMIALAHSLHQPYINLNQNPPPTLSELNKILTDFLKNSDHYRDLILTHTPSLIAAAKNHPLLK